MLGAFGAHALHASLLERKTVEFWQTAVFYHLIHSVAMLALVGWKIDARGRVPNPVAAAALCWIGGVMLFSGSLYALALGALRALGSISTVDCSGCRLALAITMGWRSRPPPRPPIPGSGFPDAPAR